MIIYRLNSLLTNYPNPFNPTTKISYALPHASLVRLSIFNTLGQEVCTLVNQFEEPGYKLVSFDASNIPTGVYFYQLQSGNLTETKKLVLLK